MSITCYLVNPRGFCSGVNRAIGMAEQVLKMYKNVYITEDLIHNNSTMDKMIELGLNKVKDINEIPDGAVILFSSHGVTPQVVAQCEKKNLTIVDATCPIIHDIQESIKKSAEKGQKIVIIGERQHAEVIGFLGCAKGTDVFVVHSVDDIAMLPNFEKCEVIYYAQTTLNYDLVTNIVSALKEKYKEYICEPETDLCCATYERQVAVKSLAPNIDLFIIISSLCSSNGTSLVETAKTYGAKQVILIENQKDIDDNMLNNVQTIAIATSASSPEYLVDETVEYLKSHIYDLEVKDWQIQEN